jgi:hypothetical protein
VRLLVEVAVVAALIAFGWSKSFSDRLGIGGEVPAEPFTDKANAQTQPPIRSAVVPAATVQPIAAPAAKATPTPDNSWMWDPNRPGSLDRKTSPRPRP